MLICALVRVGSLGLQKAAPVPPSFLQSWIPRAWPKGHLGRMPVQGTNSIVGSRKQLAVPSPICRAGGPACFGNGAWGRELRTLLSQSPAALGQAHGLPLAMPSLAGPWLSFLCLAFTLLPTQLSSLQQNVHSWQPHLFNLLPRKQDGWAGLLSQHHGGKQDSGPQLRVFLPVFLGKLVWETVLNCLSLPRLEITSAQLAALNSQAEARALSSCSRAWWR